MLFGIVHHFIVHLQMNFYIMKSLGLFNDKGGFIFKSLKLFAIKWYAVTRTIALSRLGHCVTYTLVVLLTKECGDTGMPYRWSVGVHFTERDQFRNALLSRDVSSGYGYKYPSDLRSPWWLTSNSLYFGTGLSEFLIQWRKVTRYSQVLA